MALHLVGLALLMGAIISIYFPLIAKSAQVLGSAPLANVPFFFIALIASIIIAIGSDARVEQFQKITSLPWGLLIAGIMSAVLIIGSSFLIPKLGFGTYFVLLVSGQVIAAMVFGYFGLFGAAPSPMTIGKVLGAVLVIGGVYLVTFK